jgi:hypothetical protein
LCDGLLIGEETDFVPSVCLGYLFEGDGGGLIRDSVEGGGPGRDGGSGDSCGVFIASRNEESMSEVK